MAHVTFLVCDECKRQGVVDPGREVLTYTVQQGLHRARTDLCSDHDGALRTILIGDGTHPVSTATGGVDEDRFEELIATMDDVFRAEREYAKATPQ